MGYKLRDGAFAIEDHQVDQAVGARLRDLRKSRNVSQIKLAATLGVTFQQIQKYEKGVNRISASMMARAAILLNVTVSELVGEVGREPRGAREMALALATPGAMELLHLYEHLSSESRHAVRILTQSLAVPAEGADQILNESEQKRTKRR